MSWQVALMIGKIYKCGTGMIFGQFKSRQYMSLWSVFSFGIANPLATMLMCVMQSCTRMMRREQHLRHSTWRLV